jgi:ABC transport system ATP-binding/permease protein
MAPPLLHLQNISLTFGGTPLLSGAELSVAPRERVCLIGRNGSGKSTLLKIAAGMIEADGGTRFVQPGATMRYLPQEPDFSGFATVLAYVQAGLNDGDEDSYRPQYLLNELGLTGEENPAQLSGGEARRAALARVMAPEPDILLLDEPTNHLDLPAIEWLENELNSMRSALVIISHDRRFLERLSRITCWLDRGISRRLEQGFDAFETWRDKVLEDEEIERHKLDRKIVAEEHWVRYGVTARRKRNVKRMALLGDMRQSVREQRKQTGLVKLAATEGEISGKLVAEAKHISKYYDNRAIVKNFSTRILRGDRIGIVGPNGAGKTTLISMLTGLLEPDEGEVRIGTNLQVATLDQKRASLDDNMSLRDALTGGGGDTVQVGDQKRHVMSYMKDFLFQTEQAGSPVGRLSGGERGRLGLAIILAAPSNLMVLDEPTNDLDLETLDLLQEMLGEYQGTVLLISHDRDFLDRTVDSVIVAEGEGLWSEYPGGYTDMLTQRGSGVESFVSGKMKAEAQKAASAPPAPEPVAAPKRKLSFKEKHALDTLPQRMAKLEGEIKRLTGVINDPKLYGKDPAAFDLASRQLTKAQNELRAAEEEWLELEVLREELGA